MSCQRHFQHLTLTYSRVEQEAANNETLCSLLEEKYIVHLNNNNLGHKVALLRSVFGTRQIASHVHGPRIAIKEVVVSQLQNFHASTKLISVLLRSNVC